MTDQQPIIHLSPLVEYIAGYQRIVHSTEPRQLAVLLRGARIA
jgi:hypothetical protein